LTQIYVFLNDFFSTEGGFSVQQATLVLTLIGVGGIAGQTAGGIVGQKLYNADKRGQVLLMSASVFFSVPLMLWLLQHAKTSSFGILLCSVAIIFGFCVNITGPNVRSLLCNVCTPETRGTAFSIFNLTDDLGKGFGPFLVVALINACRGNRLTAFVITTFFWLPCSAILFLIVFTVVDDERDVQREVRRSLFRARRVHQQEEEETKRRGNSGEGDEAEMKEEGRADEEKVINDQTRF